MKSCLFIALSCVLTLSCAAALEFGSVPATDAPRYFVPSATVPDEAKGRSLDLMAPPGEIVCGSFVVRSDRPVAGFLPRVRGNLPENCLDLRLVKFMALGEPCAMDKSTRILRASVLVHDDGLVRVDAKTMQNELRLSFASGTVYSNMCYSVRNARIAEYLPAERWPIHDAATLQPVDLKAGETRQYWVTAKVPRDVKPGLYTGTIALGGAAELAVNLRVLPFALPPPAPRFSPKEKFVTGVYYRNYGVDFTPGSGGAIGTKRRNEAQFRAELRNMREHGITMPNVVMHLPVPVWQFKANRWEKGETDPTGRIVVPSETVKADVRRICRIMREEGMTMRPFYVHSGRNLGFSTWYDRKHHAAELPKVVDALKKYCRDVVGHDDVVIYGCDEAYGPDLVAEFEVWEDLRKLGVRVFTSGAKLNVAETTKRIAADIVATLPERKLADLAHANGSTIWAYANPQTPARDIPRTFRTTYGLALYLAGYDGFCHYAWNEVFGHPWNEIDGNDWMMALPTADGVLDTPSNEGFREAVNDIRYFTKLQQVIASARTCGDHSKAERAKEAARWIDELDVGAVGYEAEWVRWQAIEWILYLM